MYIVRACKTIFSVTQTLCKREPISADVFLPILIYNVLKSNPSNLKSNVKYPSFFKIYLQIYNL
jgi:hypothetical protein